MEKDNYQNQKTIAPGSKRQYERALCKIATGCPH